MIHTSMKMMTLYKIIRSMPCFFKEVTHFYCPACGGTRSVIALLHLDIERAFLCNPTVVYTGVMFLWSIACTCIRTHRIINIKKEVPYERMERIFI